MRRPPVIATLLVALAVATMIALGVWQLDRRAEKARLLAQYAANAAAPVMKLPDAPDEAQLFRRVSLFCLEPLGWATPGAGTNGFRHIAQCRTGAEGLPIAVDVGVAKDPAARPDWKGGEVTGTLTHAPDATPGILRWFIGEHGPRPFMVVAERAAPGLTPTPRPDLASVPNNHLAYAVQWFIFAGIATIIYLLALRRRPTGALPPRRP